MMASQTVSHVSFRKSGQGSSGATRALSRALYAQHDEDGLIIYPGEQASAEAIPEESPEAFELAENIDNAVIMMNYRDLRLYKTPSYSSRVSLRKLWFEVLCLVVSNVLRAGASWHLHQIAIKKNCRGSNIDVPLLLGGMFLWVTSRLEQIFATGNEIVFFCKMSETLDDNYFKDNGWGLAQAILILVVKLAVEAYVAWSGWHFIVVSGSNEDIILNCLAAGFISDIDEMIFKVFASPYAKVLVKNAPTVPPFHDGRCFGSIGKLLSQLVFGLKLVFMVGACIGTVGAFYSLKVCSD